MRGKTWAGSMNGPDNIDVESLMRAMAVLHSASVEFRCSPLGNGATGGLSVRAVAKFNVLPGSALKGEVEAEMKWPNNEGREWFPALYGLLMQLDWRISQVYKNESLWR
jgi:hypothetical protein